MTQLEYPSGRFSFSVGSCKIFFLILLLKRKFGSIQELIVDQSFGLLVNISPHFLNHSSKMIQSGPVFLIPNDCQTHEFWTSSCETSSFASNLAALLLALLSHRPKTNKREQKHIQIELSKLIIYIINSRY